MELPIKITGDNILIDEITIVENRFCYLLLTEKKIIRKTFCKCEYTFDNGVKHENEFSHMNEEIFLSSELIGLEMCTYLRDSNKAKPSYMKVIFRFRGDGEIFMCFEDEKECRSAFKIAKDFFDYIHEI